MYWSNRESDFLITVVTSVTNQELFKKRLKRSLELEKTPYKLILTDPNLSYSESYNTVKKIDTSFVMFVHQDMVFLENGYFLAKAEKMCKELENFGLAGKYGFKIPQRIKRFRKEYKTHKSSWKLRRHKFEIEWNGKKYKVAKYDSLDKVKEVDTVDDDVIILPSKIWNKMKLDAKTFSFHLAWEDYQMRIKTELNKKIYVLPLWTWRIESPESYKEHPDLEEAKAKFRDRWKTFAPFATIHGEVR